MGNAKDLQERHEGTVTPRSKRSPAGPSYSRADLGHILPKAEPLPEPRPQIPSCKGAHFTWGQKEENSKEEEHHPHDLQGP